jgi:hypothetical protein
MLLY